MPYKIVQTTEGGAIQLSIVPALWENNGVLMWPPKNLKNAHRMIRDESSKPGPGWSRMACYLKRSNLRTYEHANRELAEMEKYGDTDNNENEYACRPTTQTNVVDFDALANTLTFSQPEKNYVDEEVVQIITADNADIVNNQAVILSQLEIVIENQKRIAQKLASLSVQLDETNEKVHQFSHLNEGQPVQNITLLGNSSRDESESFAFERITTKDQLDTFEEKLQDKQTRKKNSKNFSILFSSMPGEGRTCAYKLIDFMFDGNFLCLCSWSGGSKGELSKIPMKDYVNFKKLFFMTIHNWDPTFSDNDMVSFFKIVLRNANKRKGMRGVRASAKRKRSAKPAKVKVDPKPDAPNASSITQPAANGETNAAEEEVANGETNAAEEEVAGRETNAAEEEVAGRETNAAEEDEEDLK